MRDLSFRAGTATVSAILAVPAAPRACYVLAHGAGAGMRHPFLATVASRLLERSIATLRYQFPYMESGRSRPDAPDVATATVRAAIACAAGQLPGVPLHAGGKSFGGRMTSQLAAGEAVPVRSLIFLGFPLHAPRHPSISRAAHLSRVAVPMLFLQGTRDDLADLALLQGVVGPLPGATVHVVDGADHSFHVLKRSGRTDAQVMDELVDAIDGWMAA